MPSPNLRILAAYGLFFTDSGKGLLGERYMVFERPDQQYKLIMWNGRTACLSRKLEYPGARIKDWMNESETHLDLAYRAIESAADLSQMLEYYVPKPETYDRNFDMEFAEMESKIHLDTQARIAAGLAEIRRRARCRAALNWSADVDWTLRRVLKMREQGYIGPEVCLWALSATYRNSPSDERIERGGVLVEAVYWPKTREITMKRNPIGGIFRVAGPTSAPRLVSVIDQRPSLTTQNYFTTPAQ